jgi:cytochrome P450
MRLYPVAFRGVFRIFQEDTNIEVPIIAINQSEPTNNHQNIVVTIPQSTVFHVDFLALHRAQHNWGLSADNFQPERWLLSSHKLTSPLDYMGCGSNTTTNTTYNNNNDSDTVSIISKDDYSFVPFSAGSRNCLGMNLALWELRSVIFALLQHFSFRFVDNNNDDSQHPVQESMGNNPLIISDVTLKFNDQFIIEVFEDPIN